MTQLQDLPPALFLMGPTASGKTDLAVELVESLPLEIISVDSAQVYRGMDIGSAKPEPEILARAPHRLIDIRDPREAYSAAEFRTDALAAMREITEAGRIPFLVGGTMLYFRVLQTGLSELPQAEPGLRARLELEMQEFGLAALHRRLNTLDPKVAAKIHPHDPQRTLRALEVIELTGRPMSEMHEAHPGQALPYRMLKLVLAPWDRSVLHQRIAHRFNKMLLQGFEDEVRLLLREKNLTPNLPSMRSVGYRQMLAYLLGELEWGEMVERGIIATRQLAKRQYTWLRAEKDALWLNELEGKLSMQARMLFDKWMVEIGAG